MAQCDFDSGIKNVRGTISKTVHKFGSETYVTRVVASVRGGKQRVYIRKYTPRKTRVTEKEIAIRDLFTRTMTVVNSLSEERRRQFAEEAKRDKYKFNGKTYMSIHGYIKARVYAELKAGVDFDNLPKTNK